MKYFFLIFAFCFLQANVLDCNLIFEERKNEISAELLEIQEQKNALKILYQEKEALNNKKLDELNLKEKQIEVLLNEVSQKENDIKNLIKKNEELLDSIQNAKATKLSETYSKMRDSNAGAIIENMALKDAVELLYSLDAKNASKILSKVTPQKAATLTELLKKGPPFEIEE